MNKLYQLSKKIYISFYKIKRRYGDYKYFKKYTSIREVDYKEYWKKYDKHYKNLYHNFYYEKTGLNSKYFIPDSFYFSVIDNLYNDMILARFLDDKNLYDKLFYNINQPRTLAKKINGRWVISDRLGSFQDVLNEISNCEEVICKKTTSSCGGKGVNFFNKENFNKIDNAGDNLVVQEVIKQSKEMSKLCKTSINTIRVMSIIDDNDVIILSSIVRFGLEGSRVDNASSGGLTCGIEDDGKLKDVAYKPNGDKFYLNPNNNEKLSNVTIPNFDLIIESTKKCHSQFPYFGLISWDWALDENNQPVLIEGNFFQGGLEIHQLNNGPLFGNKTEYFLNKIKKHKII